MTFKLEHPLVVFDLETTGVNTSNDRIVQFAAVKLTQHGKALKVRAELSMLINPGIPIPPGASDIHSILDATVADEPSFDEIADRIHLFMNGCDWCGYNAINFDIPLLLNEFDRSEITPPAMLNVIDPFVIFKKQLPHTLQGAHTFYCKKPFDDAHDAAADVKATVAILQKQVKTPDFPENVAAAQKHFAKPGQIDLAGKFYWHKGKPVLSFGKHKNVPVVDVPADYLGWCNRQNMFTQDTLSYLRKIFRGELKENE